MKRRHVSVHNTHPTTRLRREPIAAIVNTVLKGEGVSWSSVAVVLVDDATLHRMNVAFLKHDHPTDVITFPIEFDPVEGEIYISVDRAREQASEYGVTLTNEILRLAAHGALHLAGHDDHTDAERALMTALEDTYLAQSGYGVGR